MKIFLEVTGLFELEQAEKWEEARELLYSLWSCDKNNVSMLCRAISECWYVLAEWDCCIVNKQSSFNLFKDTLVELTEYGLEHFLTNEDFLWMTGYMISMFPYLFFKGNEDYLYSKWEQKGKQMLFKATQIQPNNLISRTLYLGSLQSNREEYLRAKKRLQSCVKDYFSGNTAIEVYFKDVLSDRD